MTIKSKKMEMVVRFIFDLNRAIGIGDELVNQ
jgi:hypothetical protein